MRRILENVKNFRTRSTSRNVRILKIAKLKALSRTFQTLLFDVPNLGMNFRASCRAQIQSTESVTTTTTCLQIKNFMRDPPSQQAGKTYTAVNLFKGQTDWCARIQVIEISFLILNYPNVPRMLREDKRSRQSWSKNAIVIYYQSLERKRIHCFLF